MLDRFEARQEFYFAVAVLDYNCIIRLLWIFQLTAVVKVSPKVFTLDIIFFIGREKTISYSDVSAREREREREREKQSKENRAFSSMFSQKIRVIIFDNGYARSSRDHSLESVRSKDGTH